MFEQPRRWPLVGREEELEGLRALLSSESTRGLVLAGPAGCGRSRLAREAVGEQSDPSVACLATRSASRLPLGALVTALGGHGTDPTPASVRGALIERAGEGRLILLVDDAHLLDDLSATVILSLVEEVGILPVVTIATGDRCPDAITAMWKDLAVPRIDLHPLAPADVRRLLEQVLGDTVQPATVDRFVASSGGSPLVLRELVDSALADHVLRFERGRWALEGSPSVPSRLGDLVSDRLDRIGGRSIELAATLALAEPLSIRVLTELGFAEELRAFDDRGLIRLAPDDAREIATFLAMGQRDEVGAAAVRLDQPAYGDVALSVLGELRRRSLLSACANAIATHGGSEHDHLRVVLLRVRAGDDVDLAELLDAARRAYRVGDYERTRELAAAAWDREPSGAAGHLLGFALGRAGASREAEDVLASASGLVADDRERVLVAIARAENAHRGLEDLDGSDRICREAEDAISDPVWRSEVTAHRAMGLVQAGRIDDALALLEPILRDPDRSPRAYVKAAYAAGLSLAHAGRTGEATALAQDALPRHEALWAEDLFQTEPGVHHLTSLFALVAEGRLTEALPMLAFARDVTRGALPRYSHAWILHLSGLAEVTSGLVEDALDHLGEAIPIFIDGRQREVARWGHALSATAHALRGDVVSANEHLEHCKELGGPSTSLNDALLIEATGWCETADGDRASAAATFAAGADEVLERGDRLGAVRLLHANARVGSTADAARSADLLGSIAEGFDGVAVDLIAGHAAGLAVPPSADAAEQLVDGLETIGMNLFAAEAAAEAARVASGRGDRRAATRLAARADGLLSRCQGARTHLVVHSLSPEPLTPRERDIALLAAKRLTSREIAERLHLSPRTVDNNLRRIYRKTGVSGRGELAAVLDATGPTAEP